MKTYKIETSAAYNASCIKNKNYNVGRAIADEINARAGARGSSDNRAWFESELSDIPAEDREFYGLTIVEIEIEIEEEK
jgi:predicted ester cyclase